MNCFPIAIQAPHEDALQMEMDPIAEVADSVIDFAGKMKVALTKRFSRTIQPAVSKRLWMAQNSQASSMLLSALSRDESATVRSQVIFNPSLAKADLKRLANDPDNFVRSQARAQLAMAA